MSIFQKNVVGVRRFHGLFKFGNWLQTLPGRMIPPPFRLMQIGTAFWQSKALYAAVKLDIAEVLGESSLGVVSISQAINAQSDGVHRLLRLLTAMGVFEEVSEGVYRNNNLSRYLRHDFPRNVRAMILMQNSVEMSRPWGEALIQGLVDGDAPFKIENGNELFDYMDSNPEFASLFSDAMGCTETLIGDSFFLDFDWSRFDRIFDIGGSSGSKSASILKHNPHMKAIVVDRSEEALCSNSEFCDRFGSEVGKRMTSMSGNAFGVIPESRSDKDIYFLCAVLHAFSDEECTQILKNIAQHASKTNSRIAVMDLIMPKVKADLASASFDMQMFMGTQGKERTIDQWKHVVNRSGCEIEEVVSLRNPGKILVLKAQ